jgi:predicted DNA binding CopG/RHH family protein
LHGRTSSGSRLISLKVPEDLLQAFKAKSRLHGTPYQTKIKELMRDWLRAG